MNARRTLKKKAAAAMGGLALGRIGGRAAASVSDGAPPAPATPGRRKKKPFDGEPLFAFDAAPADISSTLASAGGRPKRKLKAIARFDPHAKDANRGCKHGEGFLCPRCEYVCSYDSRECEQCHLECYYEAGVGVVTLKERRVNVGGKEEEPKPLEKPQETTKTQQSRTSKVGTGRPRGRPPKNGTGRPRGRPPKNGTGRPRGRPPKQGREKPSNNAGKGTGRPRGRPRKNDSAKKAGGNVINPQPQLETIATPPEPALEVKASEDGAAASKAQVSAVDLEGRKENISKPRPDEKQEAGDTSCVTSNPSPDEAAPLKLATSDNDAVGTYDKEAVSRGNEEEIAALAVDVTGKIVEERAQGEAGPEAMAKEAIRAEGGSSIDDDGSARNNDSVDNNSCSSKVDGGIVPGQPRPEAETEASSSDSATSSSGEIEESTEATTSDSSNSDGSSSRLSDKDEESISQDSEEEPASVRRGSLQSAACRAKKPMAKPSVPALATIPENDIAITATMAMEDLAVTPREEMTNSSASAVTPEDAQMMSPVKARVANILPPPLQGKSTTTAHVTPEEVEDKDLDEESVVLASSASKEGEESSTDPSELSSEPEEPREKPKKRRGRPPKMAAPKAPFWKGSNPRGRPSKQVVEMREQLRALTQSNLELSLQVNRLQLEKERSLLGASGDVSARKVSAEVRAAARGEALDTPRVASGKSIDNASGGSSDSQAMAELQAKYDALLSRSSQDQRKLLELTSALHQKEQELTCAKATHFSQRGRITALQEDLAAVRAEVAKSNNSNAHQNNNPALPHHLNMPEDVSNCSSEIEELQSKMEEICQERDAAEEQIKELLSVQGQKDDLLVKLHAAHKKLKVCEKEKDDMREAASDDAAKKRKKICRLEGMVEVLKGQRDRASSRVRQLLLSGGDLNAWSGGSTNGSFDDGNDDESNLRNYVKALTGGSGRSSGSNCVEKVLASFKSETEDLAARLRESRAEVGILRSEKATAVKQSSELEGVVEKLQERLDALQSGRDGYESSFQMEHDDCLRELENVNIANNLDENMSLASLSDSSTGAASDRSGTDILAPPPPAEGESSSAPKRNNSLEAAASLDVPSLSEAEQDDESTKVEELTNALDSLNEFENFLLDLGLEEGQG